MCARRDSSADDNSKTVLLIIGIISAVIVVIVALDILICFILKKHNWSPDHQKDEVPPPTQG